MEVVIARGRQVDHFVGDTGIQTAWDALYSECAWATVFQSRGFATIWYETYKAVFEPLIVWAQERDGQLEGLLALAVTRDGTLVPCGTPQGEYYAWISRPGRDAAFLQSALQVLWELFPGQSLRFAFVPPETPVNFIGHGAPELRNAVVVRYPRPVRILAREPATASLRKKSNKSRLNRLARIGTVQYQELKSSAELEPHLDDMALFCDFRQGGIHGSFPFEGDPNKRQFFRRLLDWPGLTYTSVLIAGDTLAAYHIGFRSRREVSLGLVGHSPLLGQHSPGKLLLLLIADALERTTVERFDLTPGESYKERFANDQDTAFIVTFYASATRAAWARLRGRIVRDTRAALSRLHVDGDAMRRRLKSFAKYLSWRSVPKVIRLFRKKLASTEEMRFYGLKPSLTRLPERGAAVQFAVNQVADLLLYRPASAGDRSRQQFLYDCARRFEEEQVVFTFVENGELLHHAWIAPRAGRAPSGVGNNIVVPERSCVLWDDYTHPSARGRGLHKTSIRARAEYALRAGFRHVYINVYAVNAPSRRNIESSGFEYLGSMVREVRFGRSVIEWKAGATDYGLGPDVTHTDPPDGAAGFSSCESSRP